MKSKPTADTVKTADVIPTRDQLALMAAATQRKNPADAVKQAFAIWNEAGVALEELKWCRLGSISLPPQFPATLDDFLRLIVKGKNLAVRETSFRDFMQVHVKETIQRKRLDEPKADEVDEWASFHLKAWRDGGFPGKQQWLVTARDYLSWHSQNVSKTNRQNALNRTNQSISPSVTKKHS